MSDSSDAIIERFRTRYGKDIDLTLRPAYGDLLDRLGNPHQKLPPLFHIAGTNGKGSTCAFLRAMLEAAGFKVHVYTSPHLITVHERIRIAGKLISEAELSELLALVEEKAVSGMVSYFEATTAAAFLSFARHPADYVILETGLGGRLDATNVVPYSLASVITRLSYDHREYLGNTLDEIAREKAGIMRSCTPCFAAPQPSTEALQALQDVAKKVGAPLSVGTIDWNVAESQKGFVFCDALRCLDLPRPALLGQHQYQNAGLAIAALSALPAQLPETAIIKGLRNVEWPARLQRLTAKRYVDLAPHGAEIWLDGGHNDSAGEALAAQIERWRQEDGDRPRPLYVVFGMLTTKYPEEFLRPFAKNIARLCTVPITHENLLGYSADVLAEKVRKLDIKDTKTSDNVDTALAALATSAEPIPPRILICGSLYLAGDVLAKQKT